MPKAFINFESIKHLSNSVTNILTTIAHWHFTYAMDVKKNILTHKLIYLSNCLKHVSLIGMTSNTKR